MPFLRSNKITNAIATIEPVGLMAQPLPSRQFTTQAVAFFNASESQLLCDLTRTTNIVDVLTDWYYCYDGVTRLPAISWCSLQSVVCEVYIDTFGNLWYQLKGLYLSGLGLTGSLPNSFVQATNLEILYFGSNSLQGAVPSLPASIVEIQLFHNMFTGTIPLQWNSLKKLKTISLHHNCFSGSFPHNPLSFPRFVLLSHNFFIGPLPLFTGLLIETENNYFTGTIPATYFFSTGNLIHINLRNNSLTGIVFSCCCFY